MIFLALGNACAAIVGNRIGAGRKDEAYEIVRRVIILGMIFAVLVGLVIILLREAVVGLYDLSPSGENNVRWLLLVMASTLWIRMFNFSTFIGGLRAGGDTRFALIMEICSIWLIGVPAAYVAAFVLHLPVYLVYLMVMLERSRQSLCQQWEIQVKEMDP